MNILLFSESYFNDTIFPLFKAFRDNGHKVTLLINLSSLKIAMFNIEKRIKKQAIIKATEYEELRFLKSYVSLEDVYLVNHEVDKKHPWREVCRAIDVYKFIKKGNYDIIHTDYVFTRGYLLLYAFRKKIVITQHDPFAHTGMAFPKSYLRYLRWSHKYLNKFVILNQYQYNDYCKTYKINPERVLVNRLGKYECIQLLSPLNVKERNHNILFFGRIVEYKGLEYLCKAMKKVHEKIPDATLTIAGSGEIYFDFEPYSKLPYVEVINRYISLEELAHLIKQSSINIFPYTDATQSGAILTSFALNKPIIASNITTLSEMTENNRFGILVNPKDADSLAEGIIKVLKDDKLRDTLSNNIDREYSVGSRSWTIIAKRYIEFYNKTI